MRAKLPGLQVEHATLCVEEHGIGVPGIACGRMAWIGPGQPFDGRNRALRRNLAGQTILAVGNGIGSDRTADHADDIANQPQLVGLPMATVPIKPDAARNAKTPVFALLAREPLGQRILCAVGNVWGSTE